MFFLMISDRYEEVTESFCKIFEKLPETFVKLFNLPQKLSSTKWKMTPLQFIFQGFHCVIDFMHSVENQIKCWTNDLAPFV